MIEGIYIPGEDMELSVFPNPFSEHVDFSFERYNNQVYDFQLYDLGGKKVVESVGQRRATYRLERGNMEPGLYFYRIVMKGNVVARGKVVVQ